ncbi:MAG: glyoxalase [Hungatella sp.]|jgi:catechol 2,3-dioxygenase-like lactoylglutathione lyase family enzyme|nr:glyoxalase [Hungatella sp.]
MKLKNVLIVVSDLGRAKDFYREMFGLSVVLDGEDNVILTEGLVLQERTVWERAVGGKVTPKSLGGELYFEEPDLEGFVERLERYGGGVELVNGILEDSRGGKMVRFFDPDGNLIEVRTPGDRL